MRTLRFIYPRAVLIVLHKTIAYYVLTFTTLGHVILMHGTICEIRAALAQVSRELNCVRVCNWSLNHHSYLEKKEEKCVINEPLTFQS